ncbi:MAG: ABC transporter permease [Acidobacteriota bacterium]
MSRPRSVQLEAFLTWVGGMVLLAGRSLRSLLTERLEWRTLLVQLDRVGVRSLSIVLLTASFTGMVVALQTAYALERFGAKHVVGLVVAQSLVREMGPVLTALLVGGRVGAGITAELASMSVTEQVDAMVALGASPVQRLIVPRMLAVLLMMPLLTIVAIGVGLFGGLAVAVLDLRQPASAYWQSCFEGTEVADLLSGLGKSIFFAAAVALIACYNGLSARGGAGGVGSATTRTVLALSIVVLISNFFLTKLFLFLG